MKVIFKKHGNFLIYGILPILFLALTVALIEFTPKVSRSVPSADCTNDEQCIPTTTSAGFNVDEICNETTGKCQTVNVGCVQGEVEQTIDSCVCVEVTGQPVGPCIVCDDDEIFNDVTNTCTVVPPTTGLQAEGSGILSCENSLIPGAGLSGSWFQLLGLGSVLACLFGIRKDKKNK